MCLSHEVCSSSALSFSPCTSVEICLLRSYRLCKEEDRPTYGTSPLLGVHYGVIKEGRVRVGDAVYVC